MEGGLNKKCANHQWQNPNFYCFDDKKFLCDACFKEHRKHNIETISEIQKTENVYKHLFKKKSIVETLNEIKNVLNEIKNDVETKLNRINLILSSLNKSVPFQGNIDFFNISHQEYENIEEISRIFESMKDIYIKINNIFIKEYNNFREINKEVNIIEHSQTNSPGELNVILGKIAGNYALFKGSNNHFAIFDFGDKYYLKDILISVRQEYGCVLKNFKVSIKKEDGNWEDINSFVCQDNNYLGEMQSFPIEKETQYVKINFIDVWSTEQGNYILIKKLSFMVADIIYKLILFKE